MKYTIGIDVGGTNLKAGLVDESYRLIATRKMPLRWENAEKFAADLVELCNGLAADQNVTKEEIAWIGMGIPGITDNKNGVIVRTVNIPIHNLPIRDLIQKHWDVPVYLGNDADCAALGEYYGFSDKSIDSLILVTLGTGVGTGLIFGGKIHSGHNNCGGEGGHMVIVPGGEPCTCGRRGCWERYASANGMIRLTREAMEKALDSLLWKLCDGDLQKVDGCTAFNGLRQGDATAKQVVESYLDYLAIGITNLINLLQPSVLCIGGGLSNEDDAYLLNPLKERVAAQRYDQDVDQHTTIAKAALGNDAGIIGAALLGKA